MITFFAFYVATRAPAAVCARAASFAWAALDDGGRERGE
jgi:hypothetical protein